MNRGTRQTVNNGIGGLLLLLCGGGMLVYLYAFLSMVFKQGR